MSRILLRLAVVGSLAVGGAIAARTFSGTATAPARAAVAVRVATHALPVGTFLDEAEGPFTPWDGAITEDMVPREGPPEADVVGAVIVVPIRAGEPVRRSHLLLPGQDGFLAAVLKPGLRAVSVPVDAVSGNAGHIFPGDRVDVILTQELDGVDAAERLGQRYASETILADVRVIAVDQKIDERLTGRDPKDVARTITLEVAQADAEKIALASHLGKLSLTLRSLMVEHDTPAGSAAPAAIEPRHGPTWAADVSAVIRSVAGMGQGKAEAPPPAPAKIRIIRGKKSETLGDEQAVTP